MAGFAVNKPRINHVLNVGGGRVAPIRPRIEHVLNVPLNRGQGKSHINVKP